MDVNEYNILNDRIAQESYRVIRIKLNDFEDQSSNDEIAGFIKGVVGLQTEIFRMMELEFKKGI